MRQMLSALIILFWAAVCFAFPPLLIIVIPAFLVAYNQVQKEKQQWHANNAKGRRPNKKG